jgi:uncharacterized UBP type Zn finger protein
MKYKLAKYYKGGYNLSKFGLPNLGNSCYFNASIQLLYHLEELKDFLIKIQDQYKKDTLAYNYIELLKILDISNKNNKFESTKFNELVNEITIKCGFGIRNQQASDELLIFLLDSLKLDCISNIDHFNITNEEREKICNGKELIMKFKSDDPRSWFELKQIEEYKYKEYSINKKETNENVYYIMFFPDKSDKSLLLDIQTHMNDMNKEKDMVDHKFMYNRIEMKGSKKYEKYIINKYVFICPKVLYPDLRLIYNYKMINSKINIDKKEYELVGFIEHSGGPNGGHYVCYIKNNDKYTLFDDSNIQENAMPKEDGTITIILYREKNAEYKIIDTYNKNVINYLESIKSEMTILTILNLICKNI